MNILAREMTSAKKGAHDVHVKRFIGSVKVKSRPGPRYTAEVVRFAVRAVYGTFSGFPDSTDDAPIVEKEVVEEDAPNHLPSLKSKNDRGPSASQNIKCLRRDHGLAVPFHSSAVQDLIKNPLAAWVSNNNGFESLMEHKTVCQTNKTKLTASLKTSKKLLNTQHLLRNLELTKSTVNDFFD